MGKLPIIIARWHCPAALLKKLPRVSSPLKPVKLSPGQIKFGTVIKYPPCQVWRFKSDKEVLHISCVCSAGGRFLLKLGDKEVEYSPEFRFYMTTKLSNPHYTPEISSKTTIVNFAVKEQVSVLMFSNFFKWQRSLRMKCISVNFIIIFVNDIFSQKKMRR